MMNISQALLSLEAGQHQMTHDFHGALNEMTNKLIEQIHGTDYREQSSSARSSTSATQPSSSPAGSC